MRVDLGAVASFSRTGDEGGERAAESLETLTGITAHCVLTRTALVDAGELSTFLGESPFRFTVGFDGALGTGGTVLRRRVRSGGRGGTQHWRSCAPRGVEHPHQRVRGRVGRGADTTIDIEPPLEVTDEDRMVQDAAVVDDCAFVFESQVSLSGSEGRCRFAVVPDVESFADYLAADDAALSVEGLSAYLRLTTESAAAVESHLAAMTGSTPTPSSPTSTSFR